MSRHQDDHLSTKFVRRDSSSADMHNFAELLSLRRFPKGGHCDSLQMAKKVANEYLAVIVSYIMVS